MHISHDFIAYSVGYKLESCMGWNFVSAPARHPQNLNPPRTRRSLRNFARNRTLLTRTRPALFCLKLTPVRKLLRTHN